ncbi:MAG: hypothetical protein JNK14_21375 [Chitinophagaceae bacterium]|nr:hypothetical protein [Chitinophagaceae bacterium]
MKLFSKIVAILLLLSSCKKEKTYRPFSEKELDFVNYSPGQLIRFSDTNNVIHTFIQDTLRREFREFIGIYGRTNNLHETYWVLYYSPVESSLGFSVGVSGKFIPYNFGELNINFCGYIVEAIIDSLKPPTPALIIGGSTYVNVHTLKVYKYGSFPNNTDTATLHYNRQYGAIQLLLPGGKAVTRVN